MIWKNLVAKPLLTLSGKSVITIYDAACLGHQLFHGHSYTKSMIKIVTIDQTSRINRPIDKSRNTNIGLQFSAPQ